MSIIAFSAITRRVRTADVGDPIDSTTFGKSFKEQQKSLNENESSNNNVIIIGAGSAGLFAAYTLSYMGDINFTILEANNSTIGGRVRELPATTSSDNNNLFSSDVPYDLGAEWIHVNPRILKDLLLYANDIENTIDYNSLTIEYQPQSIYSYNNDNKKNTRMNWFRWFYKEHKFFNTTWYSYLKEYIYPYISDKVVLDSIVTSIDYSNSYNETNNSTDKEAAVIVKTSDGRAYKGSHVIIATPVTALQNNDITFIPPLPTKKINALNKVYMTAGYKVWIEFTKHFYPDLQLITPVRSFYNEEIIGVYFDANFRKPATKNIICFISIGGKDTYDKIKLNNIELINSILYELDTLYDGDASKYYVNNSYHVQNWSTEPFINGAYSLNLYDMKDLISSVNKCVYFCGEYMNEDNQATVHGAAISGRDVVKRLIIENTN